MTDEWSLRWCRRFISAVALASPVVIFWVAARNDPGALMSVSLWTLGLALCFTAVIHEARRTDEYFMKFWHKWVSSHDDNSPTMWTHTFFRVPTRYGGWKVEMHKFVQPDAEGRYHTNPYKAYRLILVGGYEDEHFLECRTGQHVITSRKLGAGYNGWVYPSTCHRISGLLRNPTYSLWVSGPRTHEVQLKGPGWPPEAKPYYLGSVPRDKMGNLTKEVP